MKHAALRQKLDGIQGQWKFICSLIVFSLSSQTITKDKFQGKPANVLYFAALK